MTLPDFFYIRATKKGSHGSHRIGAIAYTVNKKDGLIYFGYSIVHPNDRGANFRPIGCMGRAIRKHNTTPVTMSIEEFRTINPVKLLKSLGLIRFVSNWIVLGWAIDFKHLDAIGCSILKDIDGVRSDGKTMAANG